MILKNYIAVPLYFFSMLVATATSTASDIAFSRDDTESIDKAQAPSKYYVNDNTTTGDVYTSVPGVNSFTCGSASSPCRTVSFALSKFTMSPSDTLFVDTGIYEEIVTVADPVVIQGAGLKRTVFDGGNLGGNAVAFHVDITRVVINDVQVKDYSNASGKGAAFLVNSPNIILSLNRVYALNNEAKDGGAGYFADGSLSIIDSYFSSNTAYDKGGAIGFFGVRLSIDNVQFSNNNASGNGGAVFLDAAKASVVNSQFRNNTSIGGLAGALHSNTSSSLYLFKNVVTDNQANNAGGMYFQGSSVIVDSNYYENNVVNATSTGHGGGAFRSVASSLTVRYSVFNGNRVVGNTSADGGAVRVRSGSKFFKCRFYNNVTPDDGSVTLVGGLDTIYFENCLIYKNNAGDDGAIKTIGSGKVGLHYVTIANNTSANGSGGGLVAETSSRITVKNSIVYGNTASDASQNTATINVFNSIVGTGMYNDLIGNSNSDPLFVSSTDYQLQNNSPAIGLADVSINPGVDIVDEPRLSSVDVGAFENTVTVVCAVTSATSGIWKWTGAVNNDWFECGNWDANELPNTKVEVLIPNTTNTPKITTKKAFCKSIQIDVSNGAKVDIDVDSGGSLEIGD